MTDRTYEFWKEKAKKIQFPNLAFIDGKFVSAVSGKTFENINPATGIVNCQVAACDKEDVDKAVKIARQSFNKGVWSEINPDKKKKILKQMMEQCSAGFKICQKNFQKLRHLGSFPQLAISKGKIPRYNCSDYSHRLSGNWQKRPF